MDNVHRVAEVPWALDRAQVQAWLSACGDAVALGPVGAPAPPMALVLGVVKHVAAPLLRKVYASLGASKTGVLLHGDEHLQWHQTLHLDTAYRLSGKVASSGQSRAGTVLKIEAELHDVHGAAVAASSSSYLFVGAAPASSHAESPPGGLRHEADAAEATWQVAHDQPERYAAASGDANPLHLDDAAAQAMGLLRRPLHGLCTLAFAARSVLPRAQHTQNLRPAQLRGRFRRPVYPGDVLRCVHRALNGREKTFEVCNQDGHVVIARGYARLT